MQQSYHTMQQPAYTVLFENGGTMEVGHDDRILNISFQQSLLKGKEVVNMHRLRPGDMPIIEGNTPGRFAQIKFKITDLRRGYII